MKVQLSELWGEIQQHQISRGAITIRPNPDDERLILAGALLPDRHPDGLRGVDLVIEAGGKVRYMADAARLARAWRVRERLGANKTATASFRRLRKVAKNLTVEMLPQYLDLLDACTWRTAQLLRLGIWPNDLMVSPGSEFVIRCDANVTVEVTLLHQERIDHVEV